MKPMSQQAIAKRDADVQIRTGTPEARAHLDLDEHVLEVFWNCTNWERAEEGLRTLQRELAQSVIDDDKARTIELQRAITQSLDVRCLAVRHVTRSHSGPGVDGATWTKDSEKMLAAFMLNLEDYRAKPQLRIDVKARNTGKVRHAGLSTYYDRAMLKLYAYALDPISEVVSEKRSFAFRKGRAALDAQSYVFESLIGDDAPEYVVIADIEAYYANIAHRWLMKHIPMDKDVLHAFLDAGVIYAGGLFPKEDHGISEGSSLSPIIGNLVLNGLQKHVYRALNGDEAPTDWRNGSLVRYADDIVITARTVTDAMKVIEAVKLFLSERGLRLSPTKTKVVHIDEGFTFLSRKFYRNAAGMVMSEPSDAAVQKCIDEVTSDISTWHKTQRQLIQHLNSKLKGWASYHRYGDAYEAFEHVDNAVNAALMTRMQERHPNTSKESLRSKYWFGGNAGDRYYCLPQEKGCRVVHLRDEILVRRRKVPLSYNPYLAEDAGKDAKRDAAVANVTGVWSAVWRRQDGKCAYCGKKILVDQDRMIVDLGKMGDFNPRTSAYIHRSCATDEHMLVWADVAEGTSHYNIIEALEEILRHDAEAGGGGLVLGPQWKYYELKRYLHERTEPTVTLDFDQIEHIIGSKLPKMARKKGSWWVSYSKSSTVCRAWESEGYDLAKTNVFQGKITLKRVSADSDHLLLPGDLSNKRVPDNMIFEFNEFVDYLRKKYGV